MFFASTRYIQFPTETPTRHPTSSDGSIQHSLLLQSLRRNPLDRHGSLRIRITRVPSTGIRAVRQLRTVPLGGGDWVDTQDVHRVDLLQRAVLRLDDEEEDDREQSQTAPGKDQTVQVVDGSRDEAGEEGDASKYVSAPSL